MKHCLVVAFCTLAQVSWAHSRESVCGYVSNLMDAVAASPEWSDCIEPCETNNEIEVMFPTIDSLFAYEVPSNTYGYGWTVAERRSAFDQFLIGLSQTNRSDVSAEYESTGRYALLCCSDKNYTNSIGAAQAIMRAFYAPCKTTAMTLLLKLGQPSLAMNDIVLSVATNKAQYSSSLRRSTMRDYVKMLKSTDEGSRSVVTNAAVGFYLSRKSVDHLVAVDDLLTFAFNDYAQSSNRLDLCMSALERPSLSAKERTYFAIQTNLLQSCGEDITNVKALE